MSKVNYLINYLLSERDDLGRIEIPEAEQDKFRLYRSLVNIRPAVKADDDFLQAEDEYLTALTESKGITDNADLTPIEDGIYLWKGDITTLRCGAIVNAANSGMTGCWQPCHDQTYDNEEIIKDMIEFQADMKIPAELIPKCPKCEKPMTMNLRSDDKFVVDDGWHRAAERYDNFMQAHSGQHILFLELGVGYNTPAIIKYPFWKMTAQNPKAVYACLNFGEAYAPDEIVKQSICIDGDIHNILLALTH